MRNSTKIKSLLQSTEFDSDVTIQGWVRTKRSSKSISFIAVNDGSTLDNIQAIVDNVNFDEQTLKNITTGTGVKISGKLTKSQGKGQSVEIHATEIKVFGTTDSKTYPLQKKWHTLEFLRDIAHLRPRTNTFGAILRLRHAMAFAINKYFNDKGFYYIHTPIITGSDAEGAGEMFRVTTLDMKNPPRTKKGDIDYSKDFFGQETNLTVSGQLEAELAALALSEVYTFGPTFRAENSNTSRHLAEFWMVEPEMAFYDIHDDMDLAEDFLKYLVKYALDNCLNDLQFLNKMFDKELIERLESVVKTDFKRISYTEAVDILVNSGHKFEYAVEWGIDLQSEHERYLVEQHFNCPVMLTDYPKDIKAFYMKQNDDGKTVRALDVLFPMIGEIIGGSQREEDLEKLQKRMDEMNIPHEEMWWFLETRKYGSVPHSGFGLGFERLMLFVSGMKNIRDVIPFPRTPNNAKF